MATNYIKKGETLSFLNSTGAAISSSNPVIFGLWCVAIALVDIAINAYGSVSVEGVFQLTKTTGAIAQGGKVWWDATNAYCVNAPTKNSYFIGYAIESATSNATTVNVVLEEFSNEGTRVLTLAATGNETLGIGDFASGELILLVPNLLCHVPLAQNQTPACSYAMIAHLWHWSLCALLWFCLGHTARSVTQGLDKSR